MPSPRPRNYAPRRICDSRRCAGACSSSAPPTIYRALDFLIENGLIHRIERMNAFIGCSHPGEAHRGFFLICGECGNAEELHSDGLADSITSSASRRGFAARDMTLEVTGTCGDCRKA